MVDLRAKSDSSPEKTSAKEVSAQESSLYGISNPDYYTPLARFRMTGPALLFLVSHRPLAFITSQLLYGLQPLADLLEISTCAEMAKFLSTPENVLQIETALEEAERRSLSVPEGTESVSHSTIVR